MKPHFKISDQLHERALRKLVYETLKHSNRTKYANAVWYFKSISFISGYCFCCYLYWTTCSFFSLLFVALFIGVLTIFIGISVGHDAAHGSIHSSKRINDSLLCVFNFLGANGQIWFLRHNSGHHPFPNIPNVDSDIEQSKLVRLESTSAFEWWHRFQWFYLPILLCFYTLNWFFHRDIKDLLSDLKHNTGRWNKIKNLFVFLLTKAWHLSLFLIVPAVVGELPIWQYFMSFFILHVSASLIVAVVLLAAHVGEEQQFPVPSENGEMETTYFEHQLITTSDFATSNPIFNWFFGGFNHHVAHHLFPEINHVHYPVLTPIIKSYLVGNNLPYLEHTTWTSSLSSHFKLLIREGEL